MCKDLCRGHEVLAQNLREAIEVAGKYSDESSVDMLTGELRFHEKSAWMWRSMIEE
jgi:starvation-inducible DNA-binding protein